MTVSAAASYTSAAAANSSRVRCQDHACRGAQAPQHPEGGQSKSTASLAARRDQTHIVHHPCAAQLTMLRECGAAALHTVITSAKTLLV